MNSPKVLRLQRQVKVKRQRILKRWITLRSSPWNVLMFSINIHQILFIWWQTIINSMPKLKITAEGGLGPSTITHKTHQRKSFEGEKHTGEKHLKKCSGEKHLKKKKNTAEMMRYMMANKYNYYKFNAKVENYSRGGTQHHHTQNTLEKSIWKTHSGEKHLKKKHTGENTKEKNTLEKAHFTKTQWRNGKERMRWIIINSKLKITSPPISDGKHL